MLNIISNCAKKGDLYLDKAIKTNNNTVNQQK